MSDLTNQLLDAMELIADRKVAAAKYDKTIQATIVSCVDAQTGKYKIKYQGNMFYAYSNDTSTTLNDGISVYVNVPESDFSKVKTIIGTVANKGNLSSSIVTENQRYEEIGIDCIVDNKLKQPIKINNSKVDANGYMLLYSKIGSEIYINEAISEVLQDEFALNVNIGSSFLLRGTFATSIENSIADKEYFIRVQCKCVTPEENAEPIYTEYVLSSKDMYGNPLMYSIPVTQTRYFRFSEELEEIYSISIGIKNFEDEDVLSVKELELIPCRFLEDNDITSRNLRIKRPWGTQFTDEKNTLLAEVELVENGKIVTLDAKRVSYLWFIEQPDATDSQDKAGTGWKLLSTTDGTKPQFTYSKDLFPQSSRRIKCVLNYQLEDEEGNNSSATYSAVSCFYNQHPKYEDKYFTIEKSNTKDGDFTVATSHYFSSGGESIYLKGNSIAADKKYTVVWVYQDVNGDYVIQDNITYTDETTGALVTTNIIYVQAALLKNISREYVACFQDANGNFVGQQKFIIGFTNAENLDYDVNIINGDITYMYNEYGLAPTAVSSEAKVTIKEITLSLLDKKTSNLIFANTIAGKVRDNIIWYITADNKDRLVDFTDIEKDSSGKPLTTTIGGVEYVYAQGPTLSYTLKEKYNSKANSNDILVKIVYNNTTIWGTTHIQCWKVGDPGAVRGSYYIDIFEVKPYEVNGAIEYKKLNEQNYFNAFRYYAGEKQFVSESIFLQTRIWDGQSWLDEGEFSVSFEILNKLPEIYSEKEKNVLNTLIKSCILCPNTKTIYEIEPKIINNLTYSDGKVLLDGMSSLAQLVRVKITMTINNEEKNYYRTIPIAVIIEAKANVYDQGTVNTDDDRHLQIVDNSGFKYVKFDSAGNNPIYDANSPFEIGFMDKKKTLFQDSSNNYDVKWECVNQAYTIIPQEKNNFVIDDLDLLRGEIVEKDGYINPYQFTVSVNSRINISDYILYYTGVICKITDNKLISNPHIYERILAPMDSDITEEIIEDTTSTKTSKSEDFIGYIYFPIDIYKSYLDNAVINNWDGHMLDMGTDANGHSYLMSNMIGAGSKDKNNRFCGVLMGQIVSTHGDNAAKSETGIMAYGGGNRTFFLDADTGTAMFGTGESSCIKIIPGQEPKITGGGMTINFSSANPSISFSNKNFSVDRDGFLQAKGARISGHFEANSWKPQGGNPDWWPKEGAAMSIGADLPLGEELSESDIKNAPVDFSFVSRERIGELTYNDISYNNVYDCASIDTQGFSFCRKNYTEDDGAETISGITYENGELTIIGRIEANSGIIGGWRITKDAIVSANRDLVLYSNGQIMGLGDKDDDDGFIDISDKTIRWRQMSKNSKYDKEKTSWEDAWKADQENRSNAQVNAQISASSGSLSMSSSGSVSLSGASGAFLNSGDVSVGVISSSDSGIYGMKVSSNNSSGGVPSVSAIIAGQYMDLNQDKPAEKEDTATTNTNALSEDTNTEDGSENEDNKDTTDNVDRVVDKKYMGYMSINSTSDESVTNLEGGSTGIHVLIRSNKEPDDWVDQYPDPEKYPDESKKIPPWFERVPANQVQEQYVILEEIESEPGSPTRYRAVPASLEDAIQFWYNNRDKDFFKNVQTVADKFNDNIINRKNTFIEERLSGKRPKNAKIKITWKQYIASTKGYLVPTTCQVVGAPPKNVTMEKKDKDYIITEEYEQGILLNNKTNKLVYTIKMAEDNSGDVKKIVFPNGFEMKLEGFDKILAPNCPYNQKKE